MMDYIFKHKLLALVVIVILVGAAWWEFIGSSPTSILATTGTSATDTQDAQLISTLLQLQAVSLNGAIFSDPAFLSLQDFTTQIISTPIGRPDPFAPVSAGASSATSTEKLNPNLFAPAKN